jgi:hypothetical protein
VEEVGRSGVERHNMELDVFLEVVQLRRRLEEHSRSCQFAISGPRRSDEP